MTHAGGEPPGTPVRREPEAAHAPAMSAVVLVGGEGSRLRPLTERTPKPMLPLVDRPLLAYTLDYLRRHGVERARLACGYLPTKIEQHFGTDVNGLALEYGVEEEPLGTGGGIRFVGEGLDGPLLALNGDSLRDADLRQLVEFHRARGAAATILLTPVSDPTRYGLVRVAADGAVRSFLEKPAREQIDTHLINAGVYVLERDVIDSIPPRRRVSIERDVFPRLAEEGRLFAVALPGYWLDVGTPESYLQAHLDELSRRGGSWVAADADVDPGALIGERSTIGPGARVEADAFVDDAVVHAGARIGRGAQIVRAIVGEQADVGMLAEVRDLAVVGPGAVVSDRTRLADGALVAGHS